MVPAPLVYIAAQVWHRWVVWVPEGSNLWVLVLLGGVVLGWYDHGGSPSLPTRQWLGRVQAFGGKPEKQKPQKSPGLATTLNCVVGWGDPPSPASHGWARVH